MKKVILIVLAVLISHPLIAQEETLLGTDEVTHGGFGGPVVKFTPINNAYSVMVGGRGGWIINHSFIIGGGGYGLASTSSNINFGYGGLELEYVANSDKLFHFSFYTLIGAGSVNFREKFFEDHSDYMDNGSDTFFILEPAVNAELNIVSFLRINAGISYRIISGIDFHGLINKDFAGASTNLTFKFGKF